jgi:hypothetical protein
MRLPLGNAVLVDETVTLRDWIPAGTETVTDIVGTFDVVIAGVLLAGTDSVFAKVAFCAWIIVVADFRSAVGPCVHVLFDLTFEADIGTIGVPVVVTGAVDQAVTILQWVRASPFSVALVFGAVPVVFTGVGISFTGSRVVASVTAGTRIKVGTESSDINRAPTDFGDLWATGQAVVVGSSLVSVSADLANETPAVLDRVQAVPIPIADSIRT